ncbi:glycosyltransferase [Gordonia amicalis]|uniref:glycosyltransferase n=1 Tax=Gordonia amicalis TaxID=89053 RepID=UPI0022B2E395|nr:glycosyltransferase [Gordonia amicalis]MCZ4581838.1 glycosyltransferase [Gordonia amicalis]
MKEQAILESLPDYFVLGASRFVPYKALDTVIRVAAEAGVPVVVAGQGPDRDRLNDVAEVQGARCCFVDSPSDALLYALYQRAAAYIFPPIEDFGIMPVEAMAAGARVIVGNQGGASESVIDGITGVHLEDWTGETLREALKQVEKMPAQDSKSRAQAFSLNAFHAEVNKWVTPL